jgi:VWFA-related protein
MRKLPLLTLSSVMLLGLTGQSADSQEDAFAIRTALVSVTDTSGARIEELSEEDFKLVERGIERDITQVLDEEKGAELYLLVDTSVAMRRHLQQLRNGVQQFIDAIGSRFEVTLYEFGTRPRKLAGPTNDRAALSIAASKLIAQAAEGAYVLDAISETSKKIRDTEREEDIPPVIVVIFTASGPELSHTNDRAAARAGKQSGAVYHVVIYDASGQGGNPWQRARVDGVLDELTRKTGGSLKRILSATGIGNALTRVAEEELQPVYRVSFLTELSPETKPEDLEISVDRAGAEVELIKLLPGEKRVDAGPTSP